MTIKHPIKFYKFDAVGCETITVDSIMREALNKYKAQVLSEMDDEIVRAAVEAARQEGITDLALLDKQFVLDALVKAVEAWRVSIEDPQRSI